ncbi:DUF58 domain-containing protein [Halorarius halobius]|uniref:DUF58 domain-containing protein n=1 Tax=Halorarius halobius TaxID=2962671 RepID=UPI0020CEAB1E|nr:DUF58 domain-containing protein [Halorarius halobius]
MTIDPGFLDELERFASAGPEVAARHRGDQRSADRGEGLTFADYRRYAPGDDTGLVDWKLYARTEELYVKQFEVERSRTLHVLLDATGSMGYGDPPKFERAAKLGLGFAYLLAREHDEFRVALFDRGIDRLDRARSSRGEVLALVDRCNDVEPSGEGAVGAALESYADRVGSRSVVLVCSDFLTDPDDLESGLAALARNELLLAQVLTPEERELPVSGDALIENPETESRLRTHVGRRRREQYRDRLEEHLDDVAERAERLGARLEPADTDEEFFDAFARLWR